MKNGRKMEAASVVMSGTDAEERDHLLRDAVTQERQQ
jgi:hypothetical protein